MFLTLVGSLIGNWLVSSANERTKAALNESRLRAEEAEKRFRQARQAADLLVEVSEQELPNTPSNQGLRKRLLETAIGYYQDFISQHRGDASSQAELIAVQDRLKKLLDDLIVLEGAGQLILLCDRQVQADLALNDDQRERIEALTAEFVKRRLDSPRDFLQPSSPDGQSRFLEEARGNDRAMRAALTPAQLQRLEQITLQFRGPMVFDEPEVVSQLGLTETQRQAIRQIALGSFAPNWNPLKRDGGGPPMGGFQPAGMKGAMEKILAVLTPEQLAQWQKLTGPTFKGVAGFMHPGPQFFPGGHP
jgi:hypothetical protein